MRLSTGQELAAGHHIMQADSAYNTLPTRLVSTAGRGSNIVTYQLVAESQGTSAAMRTSPFFSA